jgi:hypothetical protein
MRRKAPKARVAPIICAPKNGASDPGAIPQKVLVKVLAKVTAGFENAVEEVNQ